MKIKYVILFLLLLLCSCKSTKILESNKQTTDTVFVHHSDTIREIKTDTKIIYNYNKDSISEKSYNRNDTVFTDRYFYNTQIKYIYKDSSDSIKKQHNDSTYRSKNNINNKEIIKEKSRSVFEKIKEEIGDWTLYALIFLGCIIVLKNTKIKDKL